MRSGRGCWQTEFRGGRLSRLRVVRAVAHVMANFGADRPLEAVFCIGSALQTWAQSLTQITIGRAIGGLGVGALRYPSPVLSTMSSKTFDRPPGTSVT